MLDVQNGQLFDSATGSYVDVEKARAKAKEIMVSFRAKEEAKFDAWHKNLLKCPEDTVLSKIPFDYKDMSLRTLIPEWYEESPRADVCAQQEKEANEKLAIINGIINELNKKGAELLVEFNRLYAGG